MESTLQMGLMRRPSFNILEELREAVLPSFTLSSLSDPLADIDESIDAPGDKASEYSRDGYLQWHILVVKLG